MNYPPVEKLIPQRPPMQLIDEVVDITDNSIQTKLEIRPDNIFLSGGRLENCALIECLAQSTAALLGYRTHGGNTPPAIGFLVGMQNIRFTSAAIRIGDVLLINVIETAAISNYGMYRGQVFLDRSEVCSGTLKLFSRENES